MKPLYSFLCFTLLVLTSCDKTKPICAGCGSPYPVPGVVEAIIQDTATLPVVFAVCDSMGSDISIGVISGYSYTSSYSSDSMASFSILLNSKKYIDSIGSKTTLNFTGGIMHVPIYNFYNMGTAYQADWIATIARLHLTEEATGIPKYVRINVPVGQEKTYAARFAANTGIFKSANQMFLAP